MGTVQMPLDHPHEQEQTVTAHLRLYVARTTPNSVRAEENLAVAMSSLEGGLLMLPLEIIDVFLQPKRAITDGIVVTPTLIGHSKNKRIVLLGDLADVLQLRRVLQDLVGQAVTT